MVRVGFGDFSDELIDSLNFFSGGEDCFEGLGLGKNARGYLEELLALEEATAVGATFIDAALIILVGGAGLSEANGALFSFNDQAERGEGGGGIVGLENHRVKESAVAAHSATGA